MIPYLESLQLGSRYTLELLVHLNVSGSKVSLTLRTKDPFSSCYWYPLVNSKKRKTLIAATPTKPSLIPYAYLIEVFTHPTPARQLQPAFLNPYTTNDFSNQAASHVSDLFLFVCYFSIKYILVDTVVRFSLNVHMYMWYFYAINLTLVVTYP